MADMCAVVVGPNYVLARYGQETVQGYTFQADEDTEMSYVIWSGTQFDELDTSYTPVDLTYNKVYGEDLLAQLTEKDIITVKPEANDYTIVRNISGKSFYAVDPTNLDPQLHGLAVTIGDVILVNDVVYTVTRLVPKKIQGTVEEITVSTENTYPSGKTAPTVSVDSTASISLASSDLDAAADAAVQDISYIIRCTQAPEDGSFVGSVLSIVDDTGNGVEQTITVTDAEQDITLRPGLILSVTGSDDLGNSVGNSWYFTLFASTASTTEYDGLQLSSYPMDLASDDPTADIHITIAKPYSGLIEKQGPNGEVAWDASETSIVVHSGLSLYLSGRTTDQWVPFIDGHGKLYASFRALVPPASNESVIEITTTSQITENLGTIDPDNPAAYGASIAFRVASTGTQYQKGCFVLRVADVSEEGFMSALRKTNKNRRTYAFAILTEDLTTMLSAVDWAEERSGPFVKRFRKLYFGVDTPAEYVAVQRDTTSQALKATITDGGSGTNTIVQISDPDFNLQNYGLTGTSYFTTNSGDFITVFGERYYIKRIISEREMELMTGPATPITPAAPIKIWKADTPENAASYVTNIASSLYSERATVVWSPDAQYQNAQGEYVVMSNQYLAVEMAALRSASKVQQGLTNSVVTSVSQIPKSYIEFTNLLDDISAWGVTVIFQEEQDAPCYIKHQLTTIPDKGLLYSEDNMLTIVDEFDFTIDGLLDKRPGRINVTPTALIWIRDQIFNTAADMSVLEIGDELIGPPIQEFSGLRVWQDETFKDRVNDFIRLGLTTPMNEIYSYNHSYIAVVTI